MIPFHPQIDGDLTPEVSTDEDGELDDKVDHTLKNLQRDVVRMDSDEDEMRKGETSLYRRGKSNSLIHMISVGMILPTPTAEWSVSLEQPCRKVMVTPLLLMSFGG